MNTRKSGYSIDLFYSYSHRDTQHRESMEKSLALLKSEGLLNDWSDESILPGRSISAAVRKKMESADIIVFLLSQDFIASDECRKEWTYAGELTSQNPQLFRVPVIVRDCTWQDMLADDDIKALPKDGIAITNFTNRDAAWLQVYEGIKAVVNELRNDFQAKSHFLAEMEHTEFIGQERLKLSELYVFLPLIFRSSQSSGPDKPIKRITKPDELLDQEYTLIHGPDSSGKTALGRNMFLTLVKQTQPVLYVDLRQVPEKAGKDFLRKNYESQFHGDFSLWESQSDKTLILDNLSGRAHLIDFVVAAKKLFERIIVTSPSDVFYAFFRDETRLADFEVFEITNLTQSQQETLIRKRLFITSGSSSFTDGYVDKVEDRVNSIIIDNQVVPRYPFFVLCILQTYEIFMPAGLNITSYGHCYHALIVASLARAGIQHTDSDLNTCFNVAEHLAFATFEHSLKDNSSTFDFSAFVSKYDLNYHLPHSIINRLKHEEFGLIRADGQFRTEYMRHYFLGRFLSRNTPSNRVVIQQLCEEIHVTENYLTLLFTIHHTTDQAIIDDILLRTMSTLDDVQIANLDRKETRRFEEMITGLPTSILSEDSVESERQKDRELLENATNNSANGELGKNDNGAKLQGTVNGIYRVLKNNEITGQILRNKYGNMTKDYIEEIIRIVADGGLRLVNVFLKDEHEIAEMAQFIKTKHPDYEIADIRKDLGWFSFIWTMMNVESIVKAINVPEIRESINKVTQRVSTPAYDLISYFTLLDSAPELTENVKNELDRLVKKHPDPFFKGMLSLRTQHYMNTHRSKAKVEQSICSLLEIRYKQRLLRAGS